MSHIEIRRALVAETIAELRASSTRERVVLWLGRREHDVLRIHSVFTPMQDTDSHRFVIPREGLEELFAYMRPHRLMVAAQVHTHPEDAFHSAADDRWAIVRHQGALSLVVPRFCKETSMSSFVQDALVFRLDAQDRFVEVAAGAAYTVVP